MKSSSSLLRPAIILFILLSLLTGVAYPLAITAIAQFAFTHNANGSIITGKDGGGGRPIGSSLIGQEFGTSDLAAAAPLAKWFWGRPSVTSPAPYTALNLDKGTGSSGSNLAPSNPALLDNIKARLDALAAADTAAGVTRPAGQLVPVDLVTSSASGLDPDISPAAAEYQVPRIAKARALTEDAILALVTKHTTSRTLGVLGDPVVNVLELNVALEAMMRTK